VAFYFDGVGRPELNTADSTKHFTGRPSHGRLQKEKALGYGIPITLFPNAYQPIAGHAGSASELVGMKIWPYRQAWIKLRDQEEDEWRISLFGNDNIEAIEAVDSGEVHIATLNPAAPLSLPYRGLRSIQRADRSSRNCDHPLI